MAGEPRIALFIDGANLYASAKALGFDIDYKLLRQEFDRRGKLMRAYYYTALMDGEDPEHDDEHRDHGPRDGGEPDGPTTAGGLGGPLARPLPAALPDPRMT